MLQRWIVLGTSGSGKSTLAQRLAQRLGCGLIDSDNLNWMADWKEKPHEEFLKEMLKETQGEAWVMDGNYGRVREATFPRAEAIVWMDTGFWTCLGRVFWRTSWRAWRGVKLWDAGNTERFFSNFTRNGLAWWVISTWGERRKHLEALMHETDGPKLRWFRLRHKRDIEGFFAGLDALQAGPSGPSD